MSQDLPSYRSGCAVVLDRLSNGATEASFEVSASSRAEIPEARCAITD